MTDSFRKSLLLAATLPLLSKELHQLLRSEGEEALAFQVLGLSIVDRCRCGDDFCASFYTQAKPQGSYGTGLRCLELRPVDGMVVLDVVDDIIVHVEVLYRNDIRGKLLAVLP